MIIIKARKKKKKKHHLKKSRIQHIFLSTKCNLRIFQNSITSHTSYSTIFATDVWKELVRYSLKEINSWDFVIFFFSRCTQCCINIPEMQVDSKCKKCRFQSPVKWRILIRQDVSKCQAEPNWSCFLLFWVSTQLCFLWCPLNEAHMYLLKEGRHSLNRLKKWEILQIQYKCF